MLRPEVELTPYRTAPSRRAQELFRPRRWISKSPPWISNSAAQATCSGGEQSGHIEAIGFELYTQMLERAVREMKRRSRSRRAETQLNLGLTHPAFPATYVPEENQRLHNVTNASPASKQESQLSDVAGRTARPLTAHPRPLVRNLLDYASPSSCA